MMERLSFRLLDVRQLTLFRILLCLFRNKLYLVRIAKVRVFLIVALEIDLRQILRQILNKIVYREISRKVIFLRLIVNQRVSSIYHNLINLNLEHFRIRSKEKSILTLKGIHQTEQINQNKVSLVVYLKYHLKNKSARKKVSPIISRFNLRHKT